MSTDVPPDSEESAPEVVTQRTDNPLLEVSNLKKHFVESEGILDQMLGGVDHVRAVDDVDLTVNEGETLAVVGESGCGKSTLAQTIIKLHQPTDGTIQLRGDDITDLSQRNMRPYRREMQMVFQDPLASLNPRQTVGDILRAPMEVHDIGESKADRTERAEDLLEEVGLKDGHIDRHPHQFSGGQQQRIGLARALTVEPDLMIADEPVSALDVSVQSQVLNLLDDLKEEYNLAMLFIAHDLSVVRHIADRVAVMYLGEIVETAPVEELYENPKHPYTKSLLSAVPRIDPQKRGDRIVLRGSVPSPIDPPEGCRFHTRCPSIIPPEDWSTDQETFRQAFTFRTRVEEGRIDPDAISVRLEAEQGNVSNSQIADRIVESELPAEIDNLPVDTAEAVRESARLLSEGEQEAATETIVTELSSPCVEEKPRLTIADGRQASCHRVDSDMHYNEFV